MSVKKVLKVIFITLLVLILIAVVLVGIHVFRNYSVISNLENSLKEYSAKTNYSVESYTTNSDGTFFSMKYYQNDDRKAYILENGMIAQENLDDEIISGDVENSGDSEDVIEEVESTPEINRISMYYNGERVDIFYDVENEKTAIIDSEQVIVKKEIVNNLETNNITEKLFSSFSAKIETTEINGKEYYVINNSFSPNYMYEEGKNEFVIEKETGLCVKVITDTSVTEYTYNFDNVDDEVFKEPDIGKYSIKREE